MNPKMNVSIPNELKEKIINFALNESTRKYFLKNEQSAGRRYCTLNVTGVPLAEEVKTFAKYAYSLIGVDDFIEEHMFGNFIGVNENGGSVHQHTDPRHDNGYYHIRLNFLLQKPIIGGNPIINNIEYPMEEGDSWINYASEWWHGSVPVDGGRERVVLSLGAYIHPDIVQKITQKINNGKPLGYDYSRVIRPQEDYYDIIVMRNLKLDKGWKKQEFPKTLLKFDNNICMLPHPDTSTHSINNLLSVDYEHLTNQWKSGWELGYQNIISLIDIITPHFSDNPLENLSGHAVTDTYGYPNMWGVMCTFSTKLPEVVFTNVFHELMHHKLIALGLGSGPNEFLNITKDFILNEPDELCWSIVNSYDDTAQIAVGRKATDRPVSASLHAYVSFLGVAYTYLQYLKFNKESTVARHKMDLWAERFDKSFNELLKVGKFTDNGQSLMKGLAQWTADFYKEYNKL